MEIRDKVLSHDRPVTSVIYNPACNQVSECSRVSECVMTLDDDFYASIDYASTSATL